MALPAGMTVEAEAPASAIQTILPAVQDTLFVNGLLCSNWMPVRVMLREPISRALALIVLALIVPPSLRVSSLPLRQSDSVVLPEILILPGSIWVVAALIRPVGS